MGVGQRMAFFSLFQLFYFSDDSVVYHSIDSPFDIRDVDTDSIVTFPQLIGIKKTKYLAYGMLISAAVLSIIYLKEQYAIAFVLTCFISMIFVFFTEKIIQTSTFRLV
jgi:4-hydroxybenzoate polyprenyltransferase